MSWEILVGNCLEKLNELPENSIHCCVTSPPYFALRNYQNDEQIGQEETPEEFVENLVEVFRGVKRVLRDDGTLWLNIGDTYSRGNRGKVVPPAGVAATKNDDIKYGDLETPKLNSHLTIKQKDLIGIPWRVAFALQADGWYLRSEIIWHKPNPMPESVKDRPTRAHEQIFLLTKNEKYYYDAESIKTESKPSGTRQTPHKRTTQDWEDGSGLQAHGGFDKEYTKANKRDVWSVPVKSYPGAHFATYPTELIEPCVLAGCPVDGTVIDPFSGAATTGVVACQKNRNYIGIELNPEYAKLSEDRLSKEAALENFFA
jgi:site-specific DNA-methyltransferase (adenine-specific)